MNTDNIRLAGEIEYWAGQMEMEDFARMLHDSIDELVEKIEKEWVGSESEIMQTRYRNAQTMIQKLRQITSDLSLPAPEGRSNLGVPIAIALDGGEAVLGSHLRVPAGNLAKALKKFYFRTIFYETAGEIPEILRQMDKTPTKRLPVGGRFSDRDLESIVGKPAMNLPGLWRLEVEGGEEIDAITADLLLHGMIVIGTLLNHGETQKISGDPIKKLLELHPALKWLLDPALVHFRLEGDRGILTFAAKALQEKLSDQKFQTAA